MEKNNYQDGRRGKMRWLLACLTLFWMLFIFMMSSAGKDESNSQSGAVCEFICECFVDGYEEMAPEEQIQMQKKISFPVRKGAHLSEYAILGALMTLTAASWRREGEPMLTETIRTGDTAGETLRTGEMAGETMRTGETAGRIVQILPVLGAGFLYAVSDEIHQVFVQGRSGEPRDVLIDTVGVLIGICLVRIHSSLMGRRKW